MKKIEIWFIGQYRCPIEIFFLYGKIFIFADIAGDDWYICKKNANFSSIFEELIFSYTRENPGVFNKVTYKSIYFDKISQFETSLNEDNKESVFTKIIDDFNAQKSLWFSSLTQSDLVPYISIKWNMWEREGFDDTDFHIYPWPATYITHFTEELGELDYIFYSIGEEEESSQELFTIQNDGFLDSLQAVMEGTCFSEGPPLRLEIDLLADILSNSGGMTSMHLQILLDKKSSNEISSFYMENFTSDDLEDFTEKTGIQNVKDCSPDSKEFGLFIKFLEDETYKWIHKVLSQLIPIYWEDYIKPINELGDFYFKEFCIT